MNARRKEKIIKKVADLLDGKEDQKTRVITNHVPRPLLYGYELPESQRNEFDYLDDEEFECNQFFKYRGHYYDLRQFMRFDNRLDHQWDGYHSDGFFSSIVIKLIDGDSVIVGLQLS